MRVAHILVEGASEYERKHHRIDSTASVEPADAELIHLYAPLEFPPSTVSALRVPYVASGRPRQSFFRRAQQPAIVITPENVPEAVEDAWFAAVIPSVASDPGDGRRDDRSAPSPRSLATLGMTRTKHPPYVVASFGRASVKNAIEQSVARIHRFRDDIEWHVFERAPQPDDLTDVDVWVDPATREDDFDGFVAEALVSGVPVVATRTQINLRRTEKGFNAFVVPANDSNELTHAILAALFRSEVADVKVEGARRTASKFRSRQRQRVLTRLYEEVLNHAHESPG